MFAIGRSNSRQRNLPCYMVTVLLVLIVRDASIQLTVCWPKTLTYLLGQALHLGQVTTRPMWAQKGTSQQHHLLHAA